MAELVNFEVVAAKLAALGKKHPPEVTGVVGYSAAYAVYVHEDLEAHHDVGQAKFLEQPAREESDAIAGTISKALKAGRSMRDAVLLGCLYLLRISQPLVPVDTGNLRASGFVRIDE